MLGKVIDKPSTLINLYRFDIDKMLWSMIPKSVEFDISKELLGEGGFRNAYKAQTTTSDHLSSQVQLGLSRSINQRPYSQLIKLDKVLKHIQRRSSKCVV